MWARFLEKSGKVKLREMPDNITGIEKAYERLASGEETSATPAEENLNVVIPVILDDKEFDLEFKDYGGEQVSRITQLMEFDKNWENRAKTNDRWVLFIRPGEIYPIYDLSQAGGAPSINRLKDEESNPSQKLSDQYHFIELLQALLYARNTGVKSRIDTPKLLIVMTCWDELKTTSSPHEILRSKMPLFDHFVESIWDKESYKIIGLSAQEFPLDNPEAKNRYLEEMPESFGYIVLDDNPKETDITRLIEIVLNL
ncbi:hypothetical protein FUA24_16670 [Seonamhaeicola marinus]|uniref:Double-GTPase 1 domain-containing protein n=1 Tax=Seonamhaeicola marinus TaxID=1912246 RepID=A0A5D0HU60_9FLAO|nr:hypothetical protein FUA24_16670 [Seonamhaeicola marinus]